MCQVSHFMCHVLYITCHFSHVNFKKIFVLSSYLLLSDKVVELGKGGLLSTELLRLAFLDVGSLYYYFSKRRSDRGEVQEKAYNFSYKRNLLESLPYLLPPRVIFGDQLSLTLACHPLPLQTLLATENCTSLRSCTLFNLYFP